MFFDWLIDISYHLSIFILSFYISKYLFKKFKKPKYELWKMKVSDFEKHLDYKIEIDNISYTRGDLMHNKISFYLHGRDATIYHYKYVGDNIILKYYDVEINAKEYNKIKSKQIKPNKKVIEQLKYIKLMELV